MEEIFSAHETEYSVRPDVVAKAPGRFHLIGEHSWFFKDKTLSMAVDLPVYISASRRKDSALRFYFVQLDDRKRGNLTSLKLKKEDKWASAAKAFIAPMTFACSASPMPLDDIWEVSNADRFLFRVSSHF